MNSTEQIPVVLTRKALAVRWGVCWHTIRRREQAGQLLPAVRLGKTARYSLEQIEAMEAAGTK